MSKDVNKRLPELRFPEFTDEWKPSTIEKNCNLKGRIGYRGYTKSDLVAKGKGALVLGGKHIQNQRLDLSEPTYLNWDKYYESPEIMVEVGHIIFSQRGSLGDCALIEEEIGKATINPSMVLIKDVNCNEKFLYYILIGKYIQKEVARISTNTAVPMLSQKQIKEFSFLIPSIKEQQKIANCLASLDEVINAETEKLELLQDHKKGLLQQLFPQKGETQPKYRFPEFKNDGDWVIKCVDEHFDVCSSKRVLQQDWKNEGVPFYRTRELVSLSKNEPFGSDVYISNELFKTLSKKYGVPKTGDFLVSGVGTLGISYQVKEGDKFYFKDGNVIWFKLDEGVESNFFKYSFQTTFFQKQIFGQSSASTVGTYTISNARKTQFWIPSSIKEQQKIANCLATVDNIIEAQIQKVEDLQNHKKGLLQQLFPSVNEL